MEKVCHVLTWLRICIEMLKQMQDVLKSDGGNPYIGLHEGCAPSPPRRISNKQM